MSLVKRFNEAQHFNTKVRGLGGIGSRKIRLSIKEAKRMVEDMIDPESDSPNPKGSEDAKLLDETITLMNQTMMRLKEVKETKRRK